MNIRPAEPTDLPAILALLKASLGESSSPKTAAYWHWKHEANPFGHSPVLLAEYGDQLIGVRAFMRWQWVKEGETYSALRAVDTATHPDHRGKGVFKNLTLELLERCKSAGDDFLFNTPNEQSRPGYLKMGWQAVGKLPVRLSLRRPLQVLRNKFGKPTAIPAPLPPAFRARDNWQQHDLAFVQDTSLPSHLHTPISPIYLEWRYAKCTVIDYFALSSPGAFVAGHFRAQPLGRECRLSQVCISPKQTDLRFLNRQLANLLKACPADFLSVAPSQAPQTNAWLASHRFLPALKVGPVLTFLALQEEHRSLGAEHPWAYQIGDLELF